MYPGYVYPYGGFYGYGFGYYPGLYWGYPYYPCAALSACRPGRRVASVAHARTVSCRYGYLWGPAVIYGCCGYTRRYSGCCHRGDCGCCSNSQQCSAESGPAVENVDFGTDMDRYELSGLPITAPKSADALPLEWMVSNAELWVDVTTASPPASPPPLYLTLYTDDEGDGGGDIGIPLLAVGYTLLGLTGPAALPPLQVDAHIPSLSRGPSRPAALRHPRVWSVVLRGGAEGGWQGRARNGDGRIPRGVTGVPSGAGLPGAALSSGAGISFLPWISPGAGESVRHVRAPLPPGTKHLREPWAGTGTSSGVSFARELLGRVPISMDD